MIEIKGKAGIVAKILADSINEQGNRLTTYELTYPRIIHSELLTHKMLCSNSASSRAIPFAKMAEQLTARPVRFGQANPGMQDKGEDFVAPVRGTWGEAKVPPEEAWNDAKVAAIFMANNFHKAGYHKQVYNRLTEPFQMMKTVISGTEWDNFFWLRDDEMADPTLAELARCMREVKDVSTPELLKAGEWHLPYMDIIRDSNGKRCYVIDLVRKLVHTSGDEFLEERSYTELTLEQAIKVSCARTAAVSFRNEDYGLEKCLEVYARLIGDERKHASAMQHAATPMQPETNQWVSWTDAYDKRENIVSCPDTWQPGVSHATRDGKLWSAQYCGFIMHRKLIPGENYVKE
jgi:hypothetical protein